MTAAVMRAPLWSIGFRPFYLIASAFAATSIGLWAAQASGHLPFAYLKGSAWHGHEMLFGYTLAVMAGFLLTAVRNWTGRPTASGPWLCALAALWIAGRVLVLTPYALAAALANAAFPAALAVAIGIPLVAVRNVRNYFFIGLLLAMSALVLILHLTLQGRLELPARADLQLALDIVLFIMAVMAGRVTPMFTNNGVPGAAATRHPWIERLAPGSIIALFLGDLCGFAPVVIAAFAFGAAAVHGARLYLWQSMRTLRTSLVWILHAAYAWIVVHLVLRGFAAAGLIAASFATHALTTGAIGGLTLGMMVRTARGHTGRRLLADRWEVTMFALVQAAAGVRTFCGMVNAEWYVPAMAAGGLLWCAAFALYAVRYWPVLTQARVDGKPG